MKGVLAKFTALSMLWKVATVSVACAVLSVIVATTVIVSSQKEAKEVVEAEATAEDDVTVKESSVEETKEKDVVSGKTEKTKELKENLLAKEEKTAKETTETAEPTETTQSDVNTTKNEPSASTINSDTQSTAGNAQSANAGGANAYIPPDAGQTYSYPGDVKTDPYTVVIPDKYVLPYLVNGIDIRSGDFNGDGHNDNHQNTWYEGKTWTASNGVTIRVADAYAIDPGWAHPDSVFFDGTENIEPGSPVMIAVNEYTGYSEIKDISAADLPDIATPSSKQTSINKNDASFIAYKAAFDPLWQKQNGSTYSELQALDANHDGTFDGLGLIDSSVGVYGYMWDMMYDSSNGYWKLTIRGNYTELIWDSIRNSIRMITPDGEAVYQEIYKQCYYDNPTFPEYDMWVTIGSTEVMTSINGGCYFYFK